MKQSPDNERRAERIYRCILNRRDEYEIHIDQEAAIIDVLTDLRHLCDQYGLDMGDLDRQAHEHYLEELQDGSLS